MNEGFTDARLEELKLLSEIDRKGELSILPEKGPRQDMLAFLVNERYLNDLVIPNWQADRRDSFVGLPGESILEREINRYRLESLSNVLTGRKLSLKLTHKGRVRISELKQSLKANRLRDQFGLLLDRRHAEADGNIALLEARENAPLSMGYLDMNGLKKINDENGHDAGDLALQTFFKCVLEILEEKGDGYRVGGDEVLVLLPNHDIEKARSLFKKLCQTVMNEVPIYQGKSLDTLSLSVGVACTYDPDIGFKEFQNSADNQMYLAKNKVKENNSNIFSAIACFGKDSIELIRTSMPLRP